MFELFLIIFGGVGLYLLNKPSLPKQQYVDPSVCYTCDKHQDDLVEEYKTFKDKYEDSINKHFSTKSMLGYSYFKELRVYQGTAKKDERIYPICPFCGLCIEKLYGKWWFNSKRIAWASDTTKKIMRESGKEINLEPGKKLFNDLESDLDALKEKIKNYLPQFKEMLDKI